MEKIWLQSYPEGVSPEINPDRYASLVDIFKESCQRFSDRVAFSNMGSILTYAQFYQAAENFASYLQHDLGHQRGDRIAIMLPNIMQYPVAMLGAMLAGCTVVNVNPLYTVRELTHQLKDADVKTIVIVANFADTLAKCIDETPIQTAIITEIGDLYSPLKGALVNFVVKHIKKMVPPFSIKQSVSFKQALARGAKQTLSEVKLTGDDLAYLQYTGGTTGVAKGAELTHRNLVSNVEQVCAWVSPLMRSGQEIVVTAIPLYHIFSLTANLLTFLKIGAKNILITNPRDTVRFINEIKDAKFTVLTGVNTLFNSLLNHPNFSQVDFSELALSLGGGTAVQRVVAEKWQQVTGCVLMEGYGLTETSPAVCITPYNTHEFADSVGLPVPSTLVSIRDDMGNELPIGEEGEVCVLGPQVMRGYWQRPDETAKVMHSDGALRTGDMGVINEKGFVRLLERKKDMINVSGFNVYPNEIEGVIAEHPGVLEVAVVGIPSEKSGEAVKAFVVRRHQDLTEKELVEFARKSLTAYKVPKVIEFRDELPKTNVGKILRRELRD